MQTQTNIMQGTTDFHHLITCSSPQEAADVFEDATALDTPIDLFDSHPTTCQGLIGRFLLSSQLSSPRFLGRHFDDHSLEAKTEKTKILQERTALWQRIGSGVGDAFLMHRARMRCTEKLDRQLFIHSQDIVHRVACFLAARMACLVIRIFGALDASFSAIMAKRGDRSWLRGSCSTGKAGSWLSPKRCAKCSSERAGASPWLLRATCKTGNKVWIH